MEPNKFESSWMTFSLACLIVVAATVMLWGNFIDPGVWQWSVSTAIGAYAIKSAAGKIGNAISKK